MKIKRHQNCYRHSCDLQVKLGKLAIRKWYSKLNNKLKNFKIWKITKIDNKFRVQFEAFILGDFITSIYGVSRHVPRRPVCSLLLDFNVCVLFLWYFYCLCRWQVGQTYFAAYLAFLGETWQSGRNSTTEMFGIWERDKREIDSTDHWKFTNRFS